MTFAARVRGKRLAMIYRSTLVLGLCALAAAPSSVAERLGEGREIGARPLFVQYGGRQLICDDIERRYIVNQSQLNSRILNFLLFDAAERGCLDLVERFLGAGASIKARDRFGNTALLRAARMGARDVVKRLLAQGADVDHRNLAGSTALLRAVAMNRRGVAKILLAADADVNTQNQRGISPLAAAASSLRKSRVFSQW